MFPFYTPWKHQKSLWFPGVFREYRTGTLAGNELNLIKLVFFLEAHVHTKEAI